MLFLHSAVQGTGTLCTLAAWILLALVMTGCQSSTTSKFQLFSLATNVAQINVGYFNMCVLSANATLICKPQFTGCPGLTSISLTDVRSKFLINEVHPWMIVFSFCVCGVSFLMGVVSSLPLIGRLEFLRNIRISLSFFSFFSILVTALFAHVAVSSFVMAVGNGTQNRVTASLGKKAMIFLWCSMGLVTLTGITDSIILLVTSRTKKIRKTILEKSKVLTPSSSFSSKSSTTKY